MQPTAICEVFAVVSFWGYERITRVILLLAYLKGGRHLPPQLFQTQKRVLSVVHRTLPRPLFDWANDVV
jgi:hypothetical protein